MDKARPVIPLWHDRLVWDTTPMKSSSLQQLDVSGLIVPVLPSFMETTSSANMWSFGRILYKFNFCCAILAAKFAKPSAKYFPHCTARLRSPSLSHSPEACRIRKNELIWEAVNCKVCRSWSSRSWGFPQINIYKGACEYWWEYGWWVPFWQAKNQIKNQTLKFCVFLNSTDLPPNALNMEYITFKLFFLYPKKMSWESKKTDIQAHTSAVSNPLPLRVEGKSFWLAMSSSLCDVHGLQAVVFLKAVQYSMYEQYAL